MVEDITYFDWESVFSVRRRHLPHVCQEGVVYFITYRLNDSIPQSRLDCWRYQLQRWLENHPPPHSATELDRIRELSIRRIERFLDRGHGSCMLRHCWAQDAVEEVMLRRDGIEYLLGDYVIMPNHVHALLQPLHKVELSTLLGPWRSISAKAINRRLGRTGALWQDEPFDHVVRSPDSLLRFRRYVRDNSLKCLRCAARYAYGSLFPQPPG